MSAAVVSNERSRVGGAGRVTGSTGPGAPYAPGPACSPTPRPGVSRPCSPMSATPRSRPPGTSTSARFQAYRTEDSGLGRFLMQRLIDSLTQAVPDGPEEIQTLAKALISRSQDVLAYFYRPRTSNAPTPGDQRAPGAPTRHHPWIPIPQPHPLHRPQPHPHRTPQRPPDNNHLNQAISPTHHTPKHEEPPKSGKHSRQIA